jgi:hypothetical protein
MVAVVVIGSAASSAGSDLLPRVFGAVDPLDSTMPYLGFKKEREPMSDTTEVLAALKEIVRELKTIAGQLSTANSDARYRDDEARRAVPVGGNTKESKS